MPEVLTLGTIGEVEAPTDGTVTTPDERTRSIVQTRDFLAQLTSPSAIAGVPDTVREEAGLLLHHYPGTGDVSLAHDALPMWFGPPLRGPHA